MRWEKPFTRSGIADLMRDNRRHFSQKRQALLFHQFVLGLLEFLILALEALIVWR
jgi:hypothetical protein